MAYPHADRSVHFAADLAVLRSEGLHDHPETVAALLARGADTTRVNDRGQTALAAAVIRRSDAVELLLAAGADPAHGSPSPIEVAEFFDLPDMVDRLTVRSR